MGRGTVVTVQTREVHREVPHSHRAIRIEHARIGIRVDGKEVAPDIALVIFSFDGGFCGVGHVTVLTFDTGIVHRAPDFAGAIGLRLLKVTGLTLCSDGFIGIIVCGGVGIVTIGTRHKGHARSNQLLILFMVFDEPAFGINDEGISTAVTTATGFPGADRNFHLYIVRIFRVKAPGTVALLTLDSRECPGPFNAREIILVPVRIVAGGVTFSAIIGMFFAGMIGDPLIRFQVVLPLPFNRVDVAVGFDKPCFPTEASDHIREVTPIGPRRRAGIGLGPELIGRCRVIVRRPARSQNVRHLIEFPGVTRGHELRVDLRVTGAARLGSDVGCLRGLNDLQDGFLLGTRPQQDEDRHIGYDTLRDKPPCCVPLGFSSPKISSNNSRMRNRASSKMASPLGVRT